MAKDVTSPSFIPSLLVFVKEAKMALSRLQASLIAHQKCVKQWSSKNRMEQEQRGTDWVCWKEGIGGREEPGSCWNRQKSPSLGPLAHTNPLPSVSLPPRPTYPTTTICLWWWWCWQCSFLVLLLASAIPSWLPWMVGTPRYNHDDNVNILTKMVEDEWSRSRMINGRRLSRSRMICWSCIEVSLHNLPNHCHVQPFCSVCSGRASQLSQCSIIILCSAATTLSEFNLATILQ